MVQAVHQGIEGSYSEEATIKYFGSNSSVISVPTFEDVFNTIIEEKAMYGVLPLENTTTGPVYQVYDLLGKYGCYIVGEVCLSISHCLIGVKGADVDSIKTVFSHEQGFWQCGSFLKEHKNWILEPYHNTAVSAKHVRDLGDITYGAIASRRAMELYGLVCLNDNIADQNINLTRFIITAKNQTDITEESNKISITFILSHKSGTLYNVLGIFDKSRLNLSKIESRPVYGRPWEYRFYLDFEGDIRNEAVKQALLECERISASYKMLGYYKTAIISN